MNDVLECENEGDEYNPNTQDTTPPAIEEMGIYLNEEVKWRGVGATKVKDVTVFLNVRAKIKDGNGIGRYIDAFGVDQGDDVWATYVTMANEYKNIRLTKGADGFYSGRFLASTTALGASLKTYNVTILARDKVGNAAQLTKIIEGEYSGLTTWIIDGFKALVNLAKEFVDAVLDALSWLVDWIWEVIEKILNKIVEPIINAIED